MHTYLYIYKLTDFLPNPSYIRRNVGFLLHRDIRIRRDGFHPVTFPPTLGRIDHRLGFEPRRNPVISSYFCCTHIYVYLISLSLSLSYIYVSLVRETKREERKR
jgi:hypothetical protein